MGALGRVRADPGRAGTDAVRARDLRHLGQGTTRDPEQGLPGARVRSPARHRRHTCGPGAPRRRGERAARPAGRSRGPRRGPAPAGRRPRPERPDRSTRAGGVRGSGERGGPRGALAQSGGADAAVRRVSWRGLLWTGVVAFAAAFSALSVLRHRAYNTGRFDLGNMVQAVWATAHGHPLRVTDLTGEQISRLGAHFDPILVVFAPFWRLWPSPDQLLVVQAVAVALGALPVYWLARKHLHDDRAALGFGLAYLLYPATQWLVLNEFHPVAFACPLLLFAIWYLDEDRLVPFAIFALLASTTKEE